MSVVVREARRMNKTRLIELADLVRELEARFSRYTSDPLRGETVKAMLMSYREALADYCQEQNQGFDREHWLGYIAGRNGADRPKASRKEGHKGGSTE